MSLSLSDTLRHSVTREETEKLNRANIYFTGSLSTPMVQSLPAEVPIYWTAYRDVTLYAAYINEGIWSSAVHIACTRISSLGYEVDNDVPLRVERSLKLLNSDWTKISASLTRDYLTTDNGAFIEVVRATKASGSKVLGLIKLNTFRCMRTGDPERPVVYLDRLGKLHELKSWQVAEFSDVPQELLNGIGLSATSRSYDDIYMMVAVRQYFKNKATGRRPLSAHLIGGMRQHTIDDVLTDAKEQASSQGLTTYMGAAVYGEPGADLSHVEIPFSSLPDWFNYDKHIETTQINYATAIGIDPTDLNPRLIGNKALGAGSQAQVLDEKQDSKGLVGLRQQLMYFFNDTERWQVLPGSTTFAWSESDLRDKAARADIAGKHAVTANARIAGGVTTPDMERAIMVSEGDIPQDIAERVPSASLTNEDKPIDAEDSTLELEETPTEQEETIEDEEIVATVV